MASRLVTTCDGCGGEAARGGALAFQAIVGLEVDDHPGLPGLHASPLLDPPLLGGLRGQRMVRVEACSPGCLGGLLSVLAKQLPSIAHEWRSTAPGHKVRLPTGLREAVRQYVERTGITSPECQ